MLRFSQEQLAAFGDDAFAEQLTDFLRERFPDAAAQEQIDRGHSYGLHSQRQLAVYVTTAWLLGADFDTKFPAAEEMLSSHRSGSAKQQWLSEFTQELFKSLKEA